MQSSKNSFSCPRAHTSILPFVMPRARVRSGRKDQLLFSAERHCSVVAHIYIYIYTEPTLDPFWAGLYHYRPIIFRLRGCNFFLSRNALRQMKRRRPRNTWKRIRELQEREKRVYWFSAIYIPIIHVAKFILLPIAHRFSIIYIRVCVT